MQPLSQDYPFISRGFIQELLRLVTSPVVQPRSEYEFVFKASFFSLEFFWTHDAGCIHQYDTVLRRHYIRVKTVVAMFVIMTRFSVFLKNVIVTRAT